MSPSGWGQYYLNKPKPLKFPRRCALLLSISLFLLNGQAWTLASEPTTPAGEGIAATAPVKPASAGSGTTNAPAAAAATNGPTFEVTGYSITGNTILPYRDMESIFTKYVGPAISFNQIRQALSEFQMAYWKRGFTSVKVTLPPQKLTNTLVKVHVIQGQLRNIKVLNNRYFSSNNVIRALPCLRTNIILNSLVLQRDLDKANANRDRQIYPQFEPGAEPGATTLNLKVKDHLPLHGRLEFNNYSTPGTPELRINAAAQYNNLWQLEHQVGLQYSFSPQQMKMSDVSFYDRPLIASYSAYYRAPLAFGREAERERRYGVTDFGYDEATHQFRAPPSGDVPDLTFYAARSYSDTSLQQISESSTQPSEFDTKGGLQIRTMTFNQTLTKNENLGFRLTDPLPSVWGLRSAISFGLDYKSFSSTTLHRQEYTARILIPSYGNIGPPFDTISVPNPPPPAEQWRMQAVDYVPFSVNWDVARPDKWGLTSFNLNQSFNFAGLASGGKDFRKAVGDKATGTYYLMDVGLTRQQKIYQNWGVRLHADGQWASEPLLNNEQFALGGQAGVRGYREGQVYGDAGWRFTVEPYSPNFQLYLGENNSLPVLARVSIFTDYGERYLFKPFPGQPKSLALWGTGLSLAAWSLNGHIDGRITVGYPLLDLPDTSLGKPLVQFSLSVQF